jgi:DNA-binding response OmpR family regulator
MSILSEQEFVVSVADNGEDALRAIMDGGTDLVIAAVVMAEMDGIELVRSVRALTGAPPIIVIARGHTALDHAYLRSAALAGANSTYTQPLRANDFVAGIQSALTLKRSPWVKP